MVDGYKVGTGMFLINGTTTTLETPKQGTSFYTVRIFREIGPLIKWPRRL